MQVTTKAVSIGMGAVAGTGMATAIRQVDLHDYDKDRRVGAGKVLLGNVIGGNALKAFGQADAARSVARARSAGATGAALTTAASRGTFVHAAGRGMLAGTVAAYLGMNMAFDRHGAFRPWNPVGNGIGRWERSSESGDA